MTEIAFWDDQLPVYRKEREEDVIEEMSSRGYINGIDYIIL